MNGGWGDSSSAKRKLIARARGPQFKSQHLCKKLGMVEFAYHPSTVDGAGRCTRDLLTTSLAHQPSSVLRERPCTKTIRQRAPEQNAQCAPLAYWCARPHICTCITYVEHTYSEYWYKVNSNGNEVINYAWEHTYTYITYVQHTHPVNIVTRLIAMVMRSWMRLSCIK